MYLINQRSFIYWPATSQTRSESNSINFSQYLLQTLESLGNLNKNLREGFAKGSGCTDMWRETMSSRCKKLHTRRKLLNVGYYIKPFFVFVLRVVIGLLA